MSFAESNRLTMAQRDERRGNAVGAGRGPMNLSLGTLVAGLAVVGLGVVIIRHFGPDLIRYLKIERM
jgi:hypothetical protein